MHQPPSNCFGSWLLRAVGGVALLPWAGLPAWFHSLSLVSHCSMLLHAVPPLCHQLCCPCVHTCRYLLHHRPCSSALKDFTIGTFFNRVIDDGKASDNTRHLSVHRATGEPFLLPPQQIRRVVLCTGQIYYQLSR